MTKYMKTVTDQELRHELKKCEDMIKECSEKLINGISLDIVQVTGLKNTLERNNNRARTIRRTLLKREGLK